jgi:hypothetical protein
MREGDASHVFETKELRKIFGRKRDEVSRPLRLLHDETLRDLCRSPNIVRTVTFKRLRLAGHIDRMAEQDMHTGFL